MIKNNQILNLDNRNKIVILFWISVIFLSDPGGFVIRLLGHSSTLSKFYRYSIVTIIYLCYLFLKNKRRYFFFEHKKILTEIKIFLTLWLFYYIVVYAFLNTDHKLVGMVFFAKHHRSIIQIFLVVPIIFFSANGTLSYFVRAQSLITIIVMFLFILTALFGIQLVETMRFTRAFTSAMRISLYGTGLMSFSLPIAFALVFSSFRQNKVVNGAGIAVIMYIFITITRRSILGILEYILIISFLYSIINNNLLTFISKLFSLRNISIIMLILAITFILMPQYLTSTAESIKNVFEVFTTDNSFGSSKDRLSLTAKEGIVNAIKKNFFFGTGYHPSWFSGDGGEQGWEGGDYFFLGSFAQYGLIGLLFFLPYYVISIRVISKSIKIIKNNRMIIYSNEHIFMYPVLINIASGAFMIRNLIEYPNWFRPIASTNTSIGTFIYFGFLIGSYFYIQKELFVIKEIKDEN